MPVCAQGRGAGEGAGLSLSHAPRLWLALGVFTRASSFSSLDPGAAPPFPPLSG